MELTTQNVEFAKANALHTETIETLSATVVKTSDIPALAGFATPYAVIRSHAEGGTAYIAKTEDEAMDIMTEMLYHIYEQLFC